MPNDTKKKKSYLDQITTRMADYMQGTMVKDSENAPYNKLGPKALSQANRVPDLTDVVRNIYPRKRK